MHLFEKWSVASLAALLFLGNTVAQAQASCKTVKIEHPVVSSSIDDTTDVFIPGRPAWVEYVKKCEATDEENFATAFKIDNQAEATFVAFAKLDSRAPCNNAESCKSWFDSLSESSRSAALTRLMEALVSLLSPAYDRSELENLGLTGLLSKLEENRALLGVARLQRDLNNTASNLTGVLHNTTPEKVEAVAKARRRAMRAAEALEAADAAETVANAAAAAAMARADESNLADAVRAVRQAKAGVLREAAMAASTKANAAAEAEEEASAELAAALRAAGLAPAAAATPPNRPVAPATP